MSNPVDAYLTTQETEKTAFGAGFMGKARTFLKDPMIQVGANVAAGAAALTAVPLLRKAYFAITKKQDFNQMMEANPDLQEFRAENGPQFNQHYNSLRRLNPEFAADPVVAGTYMRQMSHAPATAGKVIVESLAGRRGLQSPMQSPFKQMQTPVFEGHMGAPRKEEESEDEPRGDDY